MSVSQIVAQVTEQLTEGVSKFTLYVVRRKEEKSVIPSNLSQQVSVVSQQCNTVADLARELGQQFEEFPDILARITGEANGLESASRNLQATASNMGSVSEDIAQSWERLANSCSSIADRVIRLMEVLFQAEHNRILAVANKAQQLLAENTAFTPDQLDQNSDFCASKASDAASEVAQLSQYLQDRALVEESPQGRQILLEQAQKMQQDSENIIATINRALEDPTNPASVAAYKEAVASSSRTIQQAVTKVQQIKEQRDQSRRQSAAPKPVSPSPARAAPAAGAPRSPVVASSSSSSAAPRPVSKAPTAVVRSAADIDTKWKPQTMDQVAQAMDHVVSDSQGKDWMNGSGDLSIQIRRMAEAAKSGSRGDMLDAARTIAALSQQFAKTVKQQASTGAASASKDKLINNSLGLEDLCRQLKILASVKAGSSSLDLDRDEQLVSNTANIVRMWKELSDGLEISKIARK